MSKIKMLFVAIAILACGLAYGQNITVTGVVTDKATGEPLSGAAILVKGTPQGVVADIDGRYSIVVSPDATLGFTTIGFKDAEEAVNGRKVINVALEANAELLEETIVVAYGTASKASLTGAVAAVDSKTIEKTISSSVTAALEGAAPGVQVNNTYGEPGSTPSIRIRGFSSINGNNSPLYVVDGIPFDYSIADLNPNDIESMTVLKDAASSALYGNRAANGVVIITTKKAKSTSKPVVTFSTNQGTYSRGMKDYDRLGPDEWMEAQWVGLKNYTMSNSAMKYDEATAASYATTHLIGDMIRKNVYDKPDDQLFDASGKLVAKKLPGYTDLDWTDELEKVGYRSDYGLSFASSGEKHDVYASLGYLKENGYILNTNFERYTARVNSNFNPVKWFKGGINVAGSYQNQNYNSSAYSSYYANPFYALRYQAPVYPMYLHNDDGSFVLDSDGNKIYDTVSDYLGNRHIIFERLRDYEKDERLTLNAQAYVTFILPFGFELTAKGSKDLTTNNTSEYNNPEIGDGATNNGRFTNYDRRYISTNFQQQLTWDHDFGKHHVDALLAHESYKYTRNVVYGMNTNMSIIGVYTVGNFTTNSYFQGYKDEDALESYLARARYNYAGKYYFDASFRRDGSSRFYTENRWGNFFSVGGAWNISNEGFMKEVSWVDFLKLRASFGQVGNNYNELYPYMALYELDKNAGNAALYKQSLAAYDLQWETTQTIDVALEGRLFDRLNFNVGYFDKTSKDLIFAVKLPTSAGAYIWGNTNMEMMKNIGSVANRGFEVSADVDIFKGAFKWNFGADATFLKNKILVLPDHEDIANGMQRYSEGHSIYEYYYYHFEGVDQMTGNSVYTIDPEKVSAATSAGKLVNINGTDYTTDVTYAERNWRGSALPNVYGSVHTDLSWKGFSLHILGTYQLGGKVYDSQYASLMSISSSSADALHTDIKKSWNGVPSGMTETSPNRINPAGIPINDSNLATYNNAGSDRWLTDASYFVLKNVTLSYSLPQKTANAIGLQGVTISAGVENAWTKTARQGLNPQYGFSGGQDATYTTARLFNFGLNLKF